MRGPSRLGLMSKAKELMLDLAYKGEVACSRLQGIAFDRPARNGEYALIRKVRQDLRLAFDIGGNAGDWTAEVLANTGGRCTVACLEADARNADFIRRRFAGNDAVRIYNVAVSHAEGTGFFRPGGGELSGVGHLVDSAVEGATPIAMTTLDAVARDFPSMEIDLVKADIEGAELAMLKGAETTFRQRRVGIMQLEYNATWLEFGACMRQLFEFSVDHGYSVLIATPIGFARMPRYGIGLEDFRMRNLLLVRDDRLHALGPFGPCGRARVEAIRADVA